MLRPGLIRFILALAVIFYHLSKNIFLGYFAVGCFFILSGYWISLMFDKKYSKKQSILKVYYISRLWRLMPVFYAFSILGLIVNFFIHSNLFVHLDKYEKASAIVSNVIMLGYANIKAKILVPAWSLDVEMQFYLIFPLIAYFIKKNMSILFSITALFFLVAMYIIYFNYSFLLNTSLSYLYLFYLKVYILN